MQEKLCRHFGDFITVSPTIYNHSAQKYSDFVNPRSFVSGLLNREYDANDTEMQEMLDDLSIVIYDTRFNKYGEWKDYDWNDYENRMSNLPVFYQIYPKINEETFERIYNDFEKYREVCPVCAHPRAYFELRARNY